MADGGGEAFQGKKGIRIDAAPVLLSSAKKLRGGGERTLGGLVGGGNPEQELGRGA